jgi:hypothetical protein
MTDGRNERTMGTWGEGLYDNDGALDELGDLFDELPLHTGAMPMATTVGLATWLRASTSERMAEAVQQHLDWVGTLPEQAQELLGLLLRDPESFREGRARSAELTEILGGYCDAPRHDALLSGWRTVLDQPPTSTRQPAPSVASA